MMPNPMRHLRKAQHEVLRGETNERVAGRAGLDVIPDSFRQALRALSHRLRVRYEPRFCKWQVWEILGNGKLPQVVCNAQNESGRALRLDNRTIDKLYMMDSARVPGNPDAWLKKLEEKERAEERQKESDSDALFEEMDRLAANYPIGRITYSG